jgi:hypothetical protein
MQFSIEITTITIINNVAVVDAIFLISSAFQPDMYYTLLNSDLQRLKTTIPLYKMAFSIEASSKEF